MWAQVDLDAAAYNMQHIRRLVGAHTLIMAVVVPTPTDAAPAMARVFFCRMARTSWPACLDEAVELRRAGITAPILVLGHTDGRRAAEVVGYHIDRPCFITTT